MKDGKSLVRAGDNRYHAIFMTDGDALFVSPSSLAVPLIALGRQGDDHRPEGRADRPGRRPLPGAQDRDGQRADASAPDELLTKVTIPAGQGKNASYEVRQKQAHDWPLVLASVNLHAGRRQGRRSPRIVIYGVAPIPWRSAAAEKAIAGKPVTMETAAAAGEAAIAGAAPLSMNAYKVPLTRTVVKRALLAAAGNRYWEG